MKTSEQQAVPVAQVDWRLIAKAAGEHGIRYRTNTALLAFLDEIEPARKADRFDPAHPCKSGEGAEPVGYRWRFKETAIAGDFWKYGAEWPLKGAPETIDWGRCEKIVEPLYASPDATQTREAELREALEGIVEHARDRIQDGQDTTARAWKIGLEDIIRDADAALNARDAA